MVNILHVTNTDFLDDSRIQKEVDVLCSISHFNISIIGIGDSSNFIDNSQSNFIDIPLNLFLSIICST
jgi:hypothetical protein